MMATWTMSGSGSALTVRLTPLIVMEPCWIVSRATAERHAEVHETRVRLLSHGYDAADTVHVALNQVAIEALAHPKRALQVYAAPGSVSPGDRSLEGPTPRPPPRNRRRPRPIAVKQAPSTATEAPTSSSAATNGAQMEIRRASPPEDTAMTSPTSSTIPVNIIRSGRGPAEYPFRAHSEARWASIAPTFGPKTALGKPARRGCRRSRAR